ncbi:MAG TPA: regulatory iron-sulfur-containing complex subunit RicT, partial [Candidatus Polarisedimenticolaceae bacterium]|nr:regulatory iron-sulfur-containing complex subunit RicT [Candidatus Polarisedimenticolaceae bacterium]
MDVVGIRLGVTPRARHCDPAGLPLEVGEACLVETDQGVQFGTVVAAILANPSYAAGTKLPRVIRRADRDDEEAYARKTATEQEARAFCLGRIRERALPLKLGLVERQLDGRKMTFYFTAEGRIDFRDLVRDLSGRYNARIEMRQIGDREDAQLKGGCGPCGKQLCCSTFLKGFEPISIKMAKAQGLSLNPSKISGMCGRLMCCLKYEYDPENRTPKKKANG